MKRQKTDHRGVPTMRTRTATRRKRKAKKCVAKLKLVHTEATDSKEAKEPFPLYVSLPVFAKCAICLESKAWRNGVVCSHTEVACKDHWLCRECFLTHAKNQQTFPFKCVYPSCERKYSDGETVHVEIPADLQMRWARNQLQEVKMENEWKCPGCYHVSWFDDDFKQTNVRCTNSDCKRVYCRTCKEPAHWSSTCEQVRLRKEAFSKEENVMDQVKTQVKVLKCPLPSCVDQPALFRGHSCNRVKCPRCGTTICGNCSQVVQSLDHFCDPDTCTRPGCLHCPLFPHTEQDLEYLECDAPRRCESRTTTTADVPTIPVDFRHLFLQLGMNHRHQPPGPPGPLHQDRNHREVPEHVSDQDYAVMLTMMSPLEIRRQTHP
jgi:hypothetical protein